MKKGKELSRVERLEIGILLGRGYSQRSIARVLGRSPNTISYELRRNRVRGEYDPVKAQAKSRLRKRLRRWQWSKIDGDRGLKRLVVEKLSAHWNPDEIAGWLRSRGRQMVSKTAIYEWLRSSRGARYCSLLSSQRYYVKPRRVRTKRALIPNRVDISRRFRGSTNRSRYGHWEKDAVVAGGNSASLAVLLERKSRLVVAGRVDSLSPWAHEVVTQRLLMGKKCLSITRDNGIENARHELTSAPSFFCRPYAAWQKGGVENVNKMLRRYFPKGTNWRLVSQRKIDRVVAAINNKPRKILGYRSALEVARASGIIKSEGVLIEG